MSTPRHPGPFSGGSTPPRTSALHAQIAPPVIAADAPPPVHLPLCSVIGAMIEVALAEPVDLAWSARIGRAEPSTPVAGRWRAMTSMLALSCETNSLDCALALGWSAAVAQIATAIASQPNVQSQRLTRHAGYRDGVRKSSRRPDPMDRYRAQARDLGIERKAVA
jgi:hypothetical protein